MFIRIEKRFKHLILMCNKVVARVLVGAAYAHISKQTLLMRQAGAERVFIAIHKSEFTAVVSPAPDVSSGFI